MTTIEVTIALYLLIGFVITLSLRWVLGAPVLLDRYVLMILFWPALLVYFLMDGPES